MEETIKEHTRIEWVDISKGFVIILVVIGHSSIPISLTKWIWSFHMPFFFFISGYLFNISKYTTFSSFFKKRLQTLIKPYVIFSIIVFCWSKLINYELLNLRISELYLGWVSLALWFIPVLFFTEICFYVLKQNINKDHIIIVLLIFLSISGYFCYLNNFHLPFKLEVTFTSILFYGMGNLSNKFKLHIVLEKIKLVYVLFIFLFFSVFLSINNFPVLDMAFNIIGHYFPTYLSALFGILFTIVLSMILSELNGDIIIIVKKVISFLGINTFVILGFHQIVLMNLKMIFEKFSLPNILSGGTRHLLLWLVLFVFIHLINSHFPWVLGKKVLL